MKKIFDKKKLLIIEGIIALVGLLCVVFINPYTAGSDDAILFNYLKVVVFATLMIVLGLFYYLFTRKEYKFELMFPILLLCLGLVYIFAITPLSPPDEIHHYQSAYTLSNKLMGKDWEYGDAIDFDYAGYKYHENVKSGYLRVVSDFFSKRATSSETVKVPGPRGVNYIPVHFVQAVGITIGRLLGMNSYHVYTLGRLFNLLLTCVCLYFAIKMAPRFKMLLGLVFLLPMAVQQASGYSYDCYVNALTVLVVGYWLKLIFEEGPIALKDIIGITIFTILQAPAKTIYAFAVFLAFLVPSNRFNKKWQKWVFSGVITVIAIGWSFFWFKHPSYSGAAAPSDYVNSIYTAGGTMYSLGELIANPGKLLSILGNTLIHKFPVWVAQAVGCSLSGLSLRVPVVICVIFGLLTIVSIFCEKETSNKCKITKSFRAVTITAAIVGSFIICVQMLISWTYNTSSVIEGVQGRYFLPFVPMLFMGFASNKFSIKKDYNKFIIAAFGLLQFATVIAILVKTIY